MPYDHELQLEFPFDECFHQAICPVGACRSGNGAWIFDHQELHSPPKPIPSFLPVLMAIMFVVAFVKDIRKLDEMRRSIHLQAAAISFLLTVILTFVFDGLKSAGIYRATLSDLDTATMLIWVASISLFSVRYR